MEDFIQQPFIMKNSLKKYSGSDNSFKLQNEPKKDESLKTILSDYLKNSQNLNNDFNMNEENLKKLKILSKYFFKKNNKY